MTNITDTPYSITALLIPKMPNLLTSFRLRINANNCSLKNIKKAKAGIMNIKEGGKSNFFCNGALNRNRSIVITPVRKIEIKKLEVNDLLNSSLDFLKKSAEVDCIIPKEINGPINIKLLENKLNMPLSVGVKYLGFVNNGSKRREIPLEKKLVNMYVATDL